MKRMISIVLSAVMILSCFGLNCFAADETVELDAWGAFNFNAESTVTNYSDQLLWQFVADELGVKFNWTTVASSDRDALFSVAMADPSSLPDFLTDMRPLVAEEYGRKGALIALNDYINEEQMPNLCALMEQYPDLKASITSADGNIYFFPRIMATETRYWSGFFIRKDMLEEAGLEMPTTTDELYDVLVALKEKIDTVDYPMYYNMSSLKSMLSFFNVGGRGTGTTTNDDAIVVDGQVVYAPITDEYRTALIYFNKLLEDGLLNPDWNSLTGDDVRTGILAKTTAMAEGSFSGVLSNYNNLLIADGQGEALVYMNPVLGPQGTTTRQGHHTVMDMDWCSGISATCKDVDAVIKVVDYLYSDEGREHVYWGQEGKTYTIEDGKHVFTEEVTSATMGVLNYLNSYSGNTSCYPSAMITEFYQSTLSDLAKEGNNEITAIGEANDIRLPALRYTEDEIEEVNLILADLNAYVDEFFANAVNGVVDIEDDAVWNAYVEGFNGLRLDELMGYYETAFERRLASIE